MDVYTVILRLIHIFGGVFWVGVVFFNVGFLEPTVEATGAEGQAVVRQLMGPARLPMFMNLAAILTALSGLLMYWDASGGFRASWIGSGAGLAVTIGSLAGILAVVLGFVIQGRAAARMAALGKEIQAAGGPPSPEQAADMQRQQERLSNGAKIGAVLLAIALIGMSLA